MCVGLVCRHGTTGGRVFGSSVQAIAWEYTCDAGARVGLGGASPGKWISKISGNVAPWWGSVVGEAITRVCDWESLMLVRVAFKGRSIGSLRRGELLFFWRQATSWEGSPRSLARGILRSSAAHHLLAGLKAWRYQELTVRKGRGTRCPCGHGLFAGAAVVLVERSSLRTFPREIPWRSELVE